MGVILGGQMVRCESLFQYFLKLKVQLRSYPAPLCREHVIRDFKRACEEACTHRLLQRCFVRALRRNAEGEIDKSLIPDQILEWYDDSEAEEDTF